MNVPKDLLYSKDHEWVKIEGGVAIVGLSDHAQDSLGDIVYIELPEVGDECVANEAIANVESVKAVSEVLSPVSGKVCEVNDDVDANPGSVNSDPYGAWLYKVEDASGMDDLLDAAAYEAFCAEEE